HPLVRHAVAFHAPERRHPQRRIIAIAMDEQDRRNLGVPGLRRRGLREGARDEMSGRQGQRANSFQHGSPGYRHWINSLRFIHVTTLSTSALPRYAWQEPWATGHRHWTARDFRRQK